MKSKVLLIVCLYLFFYHIDLHSLATPTIRESTDESETAILRNFASLVPRLDNIAANLNTISEKITSTTNLLIKILNRKRTSKRSIDSAN